MGDCYESTERRGKGSSGGHYSSSSSSRRSSRRDQYEEFEEGDVWGFVNERESSSSPRVRKYSSDGYDNNKNGSYSSSSSAWHFSTATSTPRIAITPPAARNEGNDISKGAVQRSSAPVSIPNWSKTYGRKQRNGRVDMGSTWGNHDDGGGGTGGVTDGYWIGEEVEEEEEEDMVPPHEWLARKLARSQISSFSVCEGIGRTLKGRDLSQVRNAILTKTGFLE